MSDKTYDLVVIGAGPGGYTAAIRAAQLGMSVACIEKDPTLGGTCLNVGCIPSKALLDSSERYSELSHGLDEHGISVGDVKLDLAALMNRKNEIVSLGTRGIEMLFKKNKIERFAGTGVITAPGRVRVDGEEPTELSAKNILIATGSTAAELPSLPFDGEGIISSTEGIALTEVPKDMLVVGAGAIGLELGSVWKRLGSNVKVVEYMDQILPGADKDAARALMRALKKQGIDFSLKTQAKDAKRDGGRYTVTLEDKKGESQETFDVILVAVGRRPYTGGLGLESVGVALDERGRIPVGPHYETSSPGIFAIGDVITGPMLAHKAEDEGVACVERMAGVAGHVNYDAIPNVVYTWPELASVGMTEAEAKEAGHEVKVGKCPMMANARARCTSETEGLVKIIADAETDRVLGVHIVAAGASELIGETVVGMEFSTSAEDLARSTHAHPTLSEAIKEAALAVDGRAINS